MDTEGRAATGMKLVGGLLVPTMVAPTGRSLISLVVAPLLSVALLLQVARQLVHARRTDSVARVPRHALGLVYLPVKGTDFVRCVLKHDNETSAFPKRSTS